MSDPAQEQLLGHLLGALEEPEEAQIAARLRVEAALRRELGRQRRRLEVLESGRYDFAPPRGLAERTCQAVAAQAESATVIQRRPMGRAAAAPFRSVGHEYAPPSGRAARFRWVDVAVAAAVFAAASLLVVPAIQSSRFNAQVITCQGNLRQVGVGMREYSQQHGGYFPSIPTGGKLAGAGIYAPTLLRGGFVSNSRWFFCPGSSLSGKKGVHIASFDELQTASEETLKKLRRWMGGSFGYHLGFNRDGVYYGTKDLGRTHFALLADTPGSDPSNGRQSLNHGGRGQNVLFEYGGVRFVTSPRPNPQAGEIYINDQGFVAPGLHYNDSVIGPSTAWPVPIPISP